MPVKPGLIAAVEEPCLLLHGERRAPATTRWSSARRDGSNTEATSRGANVTDELPVCHAVMPQALHIFVQSDGSLCLSSHASPLLHPNITAAQQCTRGTISFIIRSMHIVKSYKPPSANSATISPL